MCFGDLAVARRERLGHALAADGEVAADLAALRNARQRMRHRHAADHEHALVALDDLGAGSAAPSPSARRRAFSVSTIEPRFRPSGPTRKMPVPPMPSSGLRMMSRCSAWKRLIARRVARHQRRRDELRELEDRELFRVVAQRRRPVEDARAFALGLLEQVGRVEVLAVERRVLAHQHRVERRPARRLLGCAVLRQRTSCRGSPVSAMRRTCGADPPPRCQSRSRGSQARARGRAPRPRASSRRSCPCRP